MKETGRIIGLAAALVVAVGLIESGIIRAQEGIPFLWVLPGSVLQYGILAVLTVPLWEVCGWSLREGRPRLMAVAAHVGVAVLIVGLWQTSYMGLGFLMVGEVALMPLQKAGLWYVLGTFFQYGALVAGVLFVQRSGQLRRQMEREAELKILAREAELRALKAQFRPHFFFNVINSLYALIETDPKRAQEMLDQVSRLMRQTLEVADDAWVPLDWEMGSVKAYLEIERIRLGDRLEVDIETDEGVREIAVPPLLLQPLVENAIKHGIAPSTGPGRVAVSASRTGRDLVLTVTDSGPGPDPEDAVHDGHGLPMTRQRLGALYGDRATLQAHHLKPSGYRITLRLPIAAAEGSGLA